MEHARHVFRVLFVLLLVVVAVIVGRTLLVPSSYGMYGPYRFDNVAEQASARTPMHAGARACAECHEEKAKPHAKGSHRTVSCEVCHGPLGAHVKDGELIAKPTVERSFKLCAYCHRKILGRPAGFKQVVLDQHVHEVSPDAKVEGKICLECHDPHSPKL
jgi:hypothetical protein